MGAVASVASAVIFGTGVWVGANYSAAADAVNEALDSVAEAAEAVMGYLRPVASSALEKVNEVAAAFAMDGLVKNVYNAAVAAMDDLRSLASSAFEKLKAAARFVRDKVIKLVRCLRGRTEAAAARRAVDRADAAGAGVLDGVLSGASASVAGFGRQLQGVAAATAPGGALACLLGLVVDGKAAHAAGLASQMMALLKAVLGVLGDNVSEVARSCIFVVLSAVGIGFETIAAAAAAAA